MNSKWILTASHCVVGTGASTRSLQIKLGEHYHRSNDGNEQVILKSIILYFGVGLPLLKGLYDPNSAKT